MKLCFLSVILLLLGSTTVHSQNKNFIIEGVVKDSLNKPIAYAQVIVTDSLANDYLAFTSCDENGLFKITFQTPLNTGYVLLQVRRLGYHFLNVKLRPEELDKKLSLILIEKEVKLEDVTIEANRPIRVQSDTLGFRLESFVDGTEDVAEDVLRKIPGITISKTGVVKYNGKEIRKILLDGDDLTDSNYKILSKNLSADLLEEVEILKNYTDNRLFKGIEKSDEIAINLKIKDGRKAPLFGDLHAKLGIPNVYSLESNLLSYGGQFKGILLLDFNNIGDNAIDADLNRFNVGNLEYRQFKLSSRLINSGVQIPGFLPQNNFLFHQSKYASLNFLAKPIKRITLRNLLSLYSNQISFETTDIIEYNTSEFVVSFEEERSSITRPRQVFNDLKAVYEIGKSSQFELRSQLTYDLEKNNAFNVLNDIVIPDSLAFNQFDYLLEGAFIQRLSKKSGMITKITYSEGDIMEDYLLKDQSLFSVSAQAAQITSQRSRNFSINNSVKANLGQYSMNLASGIVWSNQSLSNSLASMHGGSITSLNSYEYDSRSLFTELILKRTLKMFDITVGGRYRLEDFSFDKQQNDATFFEPIVGLKVSFNRNLKTGVVYNTENSLPEIIDLYTSSIITGFNISEFNDVPASFKSISSTLAHFWKYEENENLFVTSNLSVFLNRQNPFISYETNVNDSGLIEYKRVSISDRKIFGINSDVSKYFPKLSSTLKLGYKFSRSKAEYLLNGQSLTNEIDTYRFSSSTGTSFSGALNFGITGKLDRNISKSDQFLNSFSALILSEKLVFTPSNNFRFTFGAEHFKFGSGSFISLGNLNFRYSLKMGAFVGFQINNITNAEFVEILSVDQLSRARSLYNLYPRYFLVNAEFRF